MATMTILKRDDVFPAGTLVSVYPANVIPIGTSGPPLGNAAPIATAFSMNGRVTVADLDGETPYVLHAVVNFEHRALRVGPGWKPNPYAGFGPPVG
jgi:hypothetical protein